MKPYTIGFALVLGLAACTGEITGSGDMSPDDPASFDHTMFDQQALADFDLEDRAYVQGHAIGVYLYGKTLPGYIGYRYAYEPGFSSGDARVSYGWDTVMVAVSIKGSAQSSVTSTVSEKLGMVSKSSGPLSATVIAPVVVSIAKAPESLPAVIAYDSVSPSSGSSATTVPTGVPLALLSAIAYV